MVLGGDPIAFSSAGWKRPMACSSSIWSAACAAGRCRWCAAKVTGLPFPANAEIVLEGFRAADRTHAEGPFGEWTGHYAGGVREIPVLDIKAIYYRNDRSCWACRRWARDPTRWRATAR